MPNIYKRRLYKKKSSDYLLKKNDETRRLKLGTKQFINYFSSFAESNIKKNELLPFIQTATITNALNIVSNLITGDKVPYASLDDKDKERARKMVLRLKHQILTQVLELHKPGALAASKIKLRKEKQALTNAIRTRIDEMAHEDVIHDLHDPMDSGNPASVAGLVNEIGAQHVMQALTANLEAGLGARTSTTAGLGEPSSSRMRLD